MVRVNFTAPKELIERVDQFARERLEDRSTAIRQLVQEGLRAVLTERVVEQYRRGGLTLREAAARLGLDLWEFQDLLRQIGVPLSGADGEESPNAQLLQEKAKEFVKYD